MTGLNECCDLTPLSAAAGVWVRECVRSYASAFVCWASRWPEQKRACSRAHLSEPVIASWLQDIWLKCSATDYYYPFLREQFFSLSERGANIKLKKIVRRINRLPGRQQRRKLGKLNQLYLCVIGVLVNGVEGAKCTCVSHRSGWMWRGKGKK